MKFLVLTSQIFQLGGAEKLSLELVWSLNSFNINADLGIVFKTPNSLYSNNDIIKSFENEPGNWFSLDLPINPRFINIIKGVIQLIKLIKKRKYTHIETSLVTPSIIATIACMFTSCKHIVGFHQTYQPFLSKDPKNKLFFFLTKFTNSNRYYGISDYVVNSWINSRKIKFKSIITIHNSFNENFDFNNVKSNKKLVFKTNKTVILCIGRITKFKGYHILFDSLKYDLKSKAIVLYFLGSPDKQTNDELVEFKRINNEINYLGLQNHVFFLGFKNNIIEYLASCDLLVHPTQFEGFGLVLIEAMLLKKPIITTNVEAIPEILCDTGITQLPFGDIDMLKIEIFKYLQDPKSYNNIIDKGFQRAIKFNVKSRVNKIVEYSNL
jgi:glycosyltransferase involved in cell wall biosynthesis